MMEIDQNNPATRLLAKLLAAYSGKDAERIRCLFEFEDIPDQWLQILWPGCTDADIVAEFKGFFYAKNVDEFVRYSDASNPYAEYAKLVKRSWITYKVRKMLYAGNIAKNDESEIRGMLDMISQNKRQLGMCFFEVTTCGKEEHEERMRKVWNEYKMYLENTGADES